VDGEERMGKMKPEDDFIERRISIGVITNTEYIKVVNEGFNPIFIKSDTARQLISWCFDYYKKYGEAPNNHIQDIYVEKLKAGLDKGHAEWIEMVLESLSDEHEKLGSAQLQYLIDSTEAYFQERQRAVLLERLDEADKNDTEEFYTILTAFKPLTLSQEKEVYTMEQLYDEPEIPIDWLVKKLIPKGLTILGADKNMGKSYFMLNIAMHLAQGKRIFPNPDNGYKGFQSRSGQVLYISLQDFKERFKRRAKDIDPSPNIKRLSANLHPRFEWPLLVRGGLQQIEDWAKENKKPRLVIIDMLVDVWNKKSSTGGGGLYAEESAITSPLARLAHEHKISIVVLHHTTQDEKKDPFRRILGGHGITGAADAVVILDKEPGNPKQRKFSIRGKDIDDQYLLFSTENKGATWKYEGEISEVQLTEARESILDYLSVVGPTGYNDLKKAAAQNEIKVSVSSINSIVRSMFANGEIGQEGKHGKYFTLKNINSDIADRLNKNPGS